MSIRTIEEPEITLTHSQYDRLRREYDIIHRYWSGTVPPPTFYEWLREQGYGQRTTGQEG